MAGITDGSWHWRWNLYFRSITRVLEVCSEHSYLCIILSAMAVL